MKTYDPKKIEPKWQVLWEKTGGHPAEDGSKKPKYFTQFEFPYPSGDGLHVGHVRAFTSVDVIARYRRMLGYNVLFPVGWDSFGLPTENYAIKMKKHPKDVTDKNIATFTGQMKSLGYSVDWSREVDTSDPDYYKWTQWIFLELFKAGLAYRTEIPINWCPKEKTGLANEEVVNGKHERCGTQVTKRKIKQWVLKITAYADRLIDDLELVDYPERVKREQINWIGKSMGAEVDFRIDGRDEVIKVFTTRADTLFGATYMVLAPEHQLIESVHTDAVHDYVMKTKAKSDIERQENKNKTGVFTGLYAINPVNDEKIPVWTADYVMYEYGTGAIMAVPAHDERDFEFATEFKLPIVEVIEKPPRTELSEVASRTAYTGEGKMVNSGEFNGMDSAQGREKITKWLTDKKVGREKINYKLRDWIFSRQHYWGEPIPIIHCPEHGEVPVPFDDLPVQLPKVEHYEPTDTGASPLAKIDDFVNVKCPICGKRAQRETDTMPNWAGSSWYFLRYTDPKNNKEFAARDKTDYWMPVDLYEGGMEHTTLHLLYSRFWHKFLYDKKFVRDPEPYKVRKSHGIVLAHDNQKMSKSRGNVINPDDVIKDYGADTLRVYEMFMAPFDQMTAWDPGAIAGVNRFLARVYKYVTEAAEHAGAESDPANTPDNAADINETTVAIKLNQTIKKVTEDIEELHFNTAIAALMELLNTLNAAKSHNLTAARGLTLLLYPFAPHISSELWVSLGNARDIGLESWPKWDASKIVEDTVTVVVSVNGKVRGQLLVSRGTGEREVEKEAQKLENVSKHLTGKPKKIIFVPDKLINYVI